MKKDKIVEKTVLLAGGGVLIGAVALIGAIKHNQYDADGYNKKGFDKKGFDREGYNKKGFNQDGYDRDGFDSDGFAADGFDREGYNREGYDHEGYDRNGRNKKGYDREGYDVRGYNASGYNRNGFDRKGFDRTGFNHLGYDCNGNSKEIVLNQIDQLIPKLKKAEKDAKKGYYKEATTDIRNMLDEFCRILLAHYTGQPSKDIALVDKIRLCEFYSLLSENDLQKIHQARIICNRTVHDAFIPTYDQLHFANHTVQDLCQSFHAQLA